MVRVSWLVRVVSTGLLAASLAVVTGLGLEAVTSPPATAATSTTVPYTDPNAVGYIGLCDQAAQQVTSGSVDTTPFAWRAVSSEPAKAPYNGTGRTATLVAYLPVQSLPAGDWSGEALTAASDYSNATNPMAAATDSDNSLEQFIEAFPPKWDGFIQLRIYLSASNESADEAHYPALNIKVTGDTWHAVGGGTVNCSSGTAESTETILLPTTTTTTAPSGAKSGASSSGGSTTSSSSDGATTGGSTLGASGDSSSPAKASDGPPGRAGRSAEAASSAGAGQSATSSRSSPTGLIVGLIVAFLVVGVGGYLLARRRRTKPGARGADGPDRLGEDPASGTEQGAREDPSAVGPAVAVHDESAISHSPARKGD